MRIIAGTWRGRRLAVPRGRRVRPTADRVREAWMSIVGPSLPDARVLDLYAGSGALGLEALSRGAREATFVERAPASLAALTRNVAELAVGSRAIVRKDDAARWLAHYAGPAFDVAFADPPYGTAQARRVAEAWRARPFARTLGVEHSPEETLAGDETRRWGNVAVTFFYEDA